MNEPANERSDDPTLEQLLRETGARATPPDELMREVRKTVHREWRDMVAQRSRRRRTWTFAAAASLTAVAIVAGTTVLWDTTPAQVLADVGRIEGAVMRDAGLLHAARTLTADAAIYVGDEVSTAHDGRAAFAISKGFSMRLDVNSQIKLVSAERVLLERGALYIDASPAQQQATDFMVDTRVGTVRHVGTQYEVRSTPEGIEISVREGRVAIDKDDVVYAGEAGEQIAIRKNGVIERSRLAPNDPHWKWVHHVAPSFDIQNQPLVHFLDWLARETGDSIEYATDEAKQEAQQTILRGSIESLEPHAALAAVLSTTNLEFVKSSNGTIKIDKRTER